MLSLTQMSSFRRFSADLPKKSTARLCGDSSFWLPHPAILVELARILREKFNLPEKDITAYLRQIARRAEVVRPEDALSVVDDEADNRVLESAMFGNADLVVSGDRHLLKLKTYSGIPIVRPADFLHTLGL